MKNEMKLKLSDITNIITENVKQKKKVIKITESQMKTVLKKFLK